MVIPCCGLKTGPIAWSAVAAYVPSCQLATVSNNHHRFRCPLDTIYAGFREMKSTAAHDHDQIVKNMADLTHPEFLSSARDHLKSLESVLLGKLLLRSRITTWVKVLLLQSIGPRVLTISFAWRLPIGAHGGLVSYL